MRVFLALALLLLCGFGPDDASQLAWHPAPGFPVPLNTTMRDESGREVRLSAMFVGRPVILDLGYYHCPSLCAVARADLFNALASSGLASGRDYTLVSLSIDPAETSRDASEAKAADLEKTPGITGNYLTGSQQAIVAIESAVGFRARYDPLLRQFLHPAGLVILTADGIVSGYLLGVGYSGGDLRAAVLEAHGGGIERAVLPVLLLCFHYDAATGRYTLAIEKVLRLMALLTVITLGGTMIVLHRRPGA